MKNFKALILTSSSPRHKFFMSEINKHFSNSLGIVENKNNYYTTQRNSSLKIKNHFEQLTYNENKYFNNEINENNYKVVSSVNDSNLIKWSKEQNFDVICLFGTVILNNNWLETYPDKIINLHLGLSPFYRGSATLFWPFVFDEFHFIGSTIHLAVQKVDAGPILKRILPIFKEGDDYYSICFRMIKESIIQYPAIVLSYLNNNLDVFNQENFPGRVCRRKDFSEFALEQAFENIKNKKFSKSFKKNIIEKQNAFINR